MYNYHENKINSFILIKNVYNLKKNHHSYYRIYKDDFFEIIKQKTVTNTGWQQYVVEILNSNNI